MIFIGDVHGKWSELNKIITEHPDKDIFQVGDLGFHNFNEFKPSEKTRWIRGNHDNPAISVNHPNYLGDYGFWKEKEIFFVGGAWSIDQYYRVPGVSWWEDEELSYTELQSMIQLYREIRPKIVVTHDCPNIVRKKIFNISKGSKTSNALDVIFEINQPELWIFGHHHKSINVKIDNTRFRCLAELEVFET